MSALTKLTSSQTDVADFLIVELIQKKNGNGQESMESVLTVKGSPYSIAERRVPELITVLGSQPAGDVSHKPVGRLPLLSVRPVVTWQLLRELLPILLLSEQRHDGCKQLQRQLEPRPFCA